MAWGQVSGQFRISGFSHGWRAPGNGYTLPPYELHAFVGVPESGGSLQDKTLVNVAISHEEVLSFLPLYEPLSGFDGIVMRSLFTELYGGNYFDYSGVRGVDYTLSASDYRRAWGHYYDHESQNLTPDQRLRSGHVILQVTFPGGDVPFPNAYDLPAHAITYTGWTGATETSLDSIVVDTGRKTEATIPMKRANDSPLRRPAKTTSPSAAR